MSLRREHPILIPITINIWMQKGNNNEYYMRYNGWRHWRKVLAKI